MEELALALRSQLEEATQAKRKEANIINF